MNTRSYENNQRFFEKCAGMTAAQLGSYIRNCLTNFEQDIDIPGRETTYDELIGLFERKLIEEELYAHRAVNPEIEYRITWVLKNRLGLNKGQNSGDSGFDRLTVRDCRKILSRIGASQGGGRLVLLIALWDELLNCHQVRILVQRNSFY